MTDKMSTQRAEFDAANDFSRALSNLMSLAVVDDDYPQVRYEYELALGLLIAAMKENKRFVMGNRHGLLQTDSLVLESIEATPQDDYLANSGQTCPACGANDGDKRGENVGINLNLARQEVTCGTCGANWVDVYTLSGFEGLEAGDAALDVEALEKRYSPEGDGEHPTFVRERWQQEVASGDTISGYWEWVGHVVRSPV